MGRVAIFLKPTNNVIPMDNAMMSVSFVKEIINAVSEEYTNNLFSFNQKSNKKIKDINTALYTPNFVCKGNELYVNEEIIFNISFFKEEMFYYIYNGALKVKNLKYKNYEFKVNKVSIPIEKTIDDEGVIFKTQSPIIIKNKNGRYLDINDEEYVPNLNYIADLTLKNIRGFGLRKELEFTSLNLKKRVLKQKIRNFNKREFYYINAYTGTFFLKGNRDDLEALYKTGIGFRRSQNAGMVEILK